MSNIVKSVQSYSNDHLPYYCPFYYLVHALFFSMHNVACEFRGCGETISMNVLKKTMTDFY